MYLKQTSCPFSKKKKKRFSEGTKTLINIHKQYTMVLKYRFWLLMISIRRDCTPPDIVLIFWCSYLNYCLSLLLMFLFFCVHMTWLCTYTSCHCFIIILVFLSLIFSNVLCLYAFLCFYDINDIL